MRGHSKSLCTYFISEKDKTKLFTLQMTFISFNIQILISIVKFVWYYWRCDSEKQHFLIMRKILCYETRWQETHCENSLYTHKSSKKRQSTVKIVTKLGWKKVYDSTNKCCNSRHCQFNCQNSKIRERCEMTNESCNNIDIGDRRQKIQEDKKLKNSRMITNCRYRNTSKILKIANWYTNN